MDNIDNMDSIAYGGFAAQGMWMFFLFLSIYPNGSPLLDFSNLWKTAFIIFIPLIISIIILIVVLAVVLVNKFVRKT